MELITLLLDIEEHELKMVEPLTKEALGKSPMALDRDGSLLMQPLAHQMRPGKGKCQQG
jgi:hypothetical protein